MENWQENIQTLPRLDAQSQPTESMEPIMLLLPPGSTSPFSPSAQAISSPTSHYKPSARNVLPPITPSSYVTRSILLQDSEYHARLAALRSSCLYGVQLTPIEAESKLYSKDPSSPTQSRHHIPRLFTLSAPHIRENYPPLSLSDTVWLRQLRPWNCTIQPFVIEARVHSIQRIAGTVTLSCDTLASPEEGGGGFWESGIFNVEWSPQKRQFTLCRTALEFLYRDISAAASLSSSSFTGRSPILSPRHNDNDVRDHAVIGDEQPQEKAAPKSLPACWLFPEDTDWSESREDYRHWVGSSSKESRLKWIDPELNEEQMVSLRQAP